MKLLLKFGIILVAILGLLRPVHAQISLPFRGGEYNESEPIHVGIHFTYRMSHYVIAHKQGWEQMSAPLPGSGNVVNFKSITSHPSGHNIGVGIPIDWRINGNLNLMFSPTFYPQFSGLNMGESIRFIYGEDELIKRTRRFGNSNTSAANYDPEDDYFNFPSFDFPLHLKFRSDAKYIDSRARLGKYKLYMLAGGKYTVNVDRNKHYSGQLGGLGADQLPLIAKGGFPSWEAGAGIDLFFTFFKMSLEARFAQSFGSALDHDSPYAVGNPFMAPIERARLRSFQFSVILE